MVHKPPFPDNYDVPTVVNDWIFNPDSNKNGHIWEGENTARSVGVFSKIGAEGVDVRVLDDRVNGFARKITPYEREAKPGEDHKSLIRWGIEKAVRWMEQHSSESWKHSAVNEAALDPPPGYTLEYYFLEEREHIIYYRREGAKSESSLFPDRDYDEIEPTIDNWGYLTVQTYRGSGNSTIALAPWVRAHDHQLHEVANPPEECGLDVALKLAREYVIENSDHEPSGPISGQTGLNTWA